MTHFDYQKFREATEHYYKSLVGPMGTGIQMTNCSNIRMYNNLFVEKYTVKFEVGD